MNIDMDIDTGIEHQPPEGLKHHQKRKDGKYYANLKIRHYLIKLHQEAFPELAEQMKRDPSNATNIYLVWLSLLPLTIKNMMNENLRRKIMKTYKLI